MNAEFQSIVGRRVSYTAAQKVIGEKPPTYHGIVRGVWISAPEGWVMALVEKTDGPAGAVLGTEGSMVVSFLTSFTFLQTNETDNQTH